MKIVLVLFLLGHAAAIAQTKLPEAAVPATIVSVIEGVTSKRFVADTIARGTLRAKEEEKPK